jgi:hypothetical protein
MMSQSHWILFCRQKRKKKEKEKALISRHIRREGESAAGKKEFVLVAMLPKESGPQKQTQKKEDEEEEEEEEAAAAQAQASTDLQKFSSFWPISKSTL